MLSLDQVKNYLQELFISQEMLVNRPYDAFRQLLSAGIMVVVVIALYAFLLLHIFVTGLYQLAMLNFVVAFIGIVLLYRLYKTKKMGSQGHIMTVLIIGYFLVFTYVNKGAEYSLIFGLFVPFMAIAMVGLRNGLRYLLFYYVMMFSMVIWGLNHWNPFYWTEASLFRFILASLTSLVLAVLMEVSNSGLNRKIIKQRESEKLYVEKLRRLSMIDALTELYNRHYFQEVLEKKFKELKNTDLYLTFFILDIDYFKLYNDEFGHQQGDEVLKKVATTVHSYIKRKDDLVFRLGGEEFGGLLVTESPQETSEWISKLKEEVEGLKIVHSTKAPEKYITISIGIFSAKIDSLDSLTCIYRVADKALYQAKNKGRNQAHIILPTNKEGLCA